MKKSPNILLVEDDALIRKILSDELKVNGFGVEEAADGEECLAAIDSKNIDLVLLDIMIPKKDGIAVLRELKQAGKIPQLPVYILRSEECLAAIDSKNIDLVLLDIMIPKKDGIAVLRELKQAGKIPQLPVYILSSLSGIEKVAEGIALGARGYFVKQESGREEIIKAVRALFAPQ